MAQSKVAAQAFKDNYVAGLIEAGATAPMPTMPEQDLGEIASLQIDLDRGRYMLKNDGDRRTIIMKDGVARKPGFAGNRPHRAGDDSMDMVFKNNPVGQYFGNGITLDNYGDGTTANPIPNAPKNRGFYGAEKSGNLTDIGYAGAHSSFVNGRPLNNGEALPYVRDNAWNMPRGGFNSQDAQNLVNNPLPSINPFTNDAKDYLKRSMFMEEKLGR